MSESRSSKDGSSKSHRSGKSSSKDEERRKRSPPREDEEKPEKSGKSEKRTDKEYDSEKSKKRKSSPPVPDIHSANNWESVDLGDNERKAKFLRLMGAAKKDHHGKLIIGETPALPEHQHNRPPQDEAKITDDLEKQFVETLEHTVKGDARRHVGLGFSSSAGLSSSGGGTHTRFDSPEDASPPKPKPKSTYMGFVKGSS